MSTPRGGFNAEIVELSDLRGKVNSRTVYRPVNGSSVSDLRLHWDGDRVMFTQTQEDWRWNVFEVRLDGSGFRKMIENDILFLIGLVVFVALYFVDAGYGKMRTEKWGPAINNKVGWCLMEMPVFVVMLYLWAMSEVKFQLPYLIFFLRSSSSAFTDE